MFHRVKNGCYRHYKYILQAIIHDRLENTIAEHNVLSARNTTSMD